MAAKPSKALPMEECAIADIEMMKIAMEQEPVNMTDSVFLNYVRFHYIMRNIPVLSTHFEAKKTKDEGNRETYEFGPIILSSAKRQPGKAVVYFLDNFLKLPFQTKEQPSPMYEPNALRHVYYIEWSGWSPKQFSEDQRTFWTYFDEIGCNNFVFAGNRKKYVPWICVHEVPLGSSLQIKMQQIPLHIQQCLGKRPVETSDGSATRWQGHPWQSLTPEIIQHAELVHTQNPQEFAKNHPHLRHFVYNEKNLVVLSDQEKIKLDLIHQKWYKDLMAQKLNEKDAAEFLKNIAENLIQLHRFYVAADLDTFDLVLIQMLSLSELVKLYVCSPIPRKSATVKLPAFTQEMQNTAQALSSILCLYTNKKTGGSGKCLALVAEPPDADSCAFLKKLDVDWNEVEEMNEDAQTGTGGLKQFKNNKKGSVLTAPTAPPNAAQIQRFYVKHEGPINEFLFQLACLLRYPYESIIDWEATVLDKNDLLYLQLGFNAQATTTQQPMILINNNTTSSNSSSNSNSSSSSNTGPGSNKKSR